MAWAGCSPLPAPGPAQLLSRGGSGAGGLSCGRASRLPAGAPGLRSSRKLVGQLFAEPLEVAEPQEIAEPQEAAAPQESVERGGPIAKEDIWKIWTERLVLPNPKGWVLYAGEWNTCETMDASDLKEFKTAIRCFRLEDEEGRKLNHINLMNKRPGAGPVATRRPDGWVEVSYPRDIEQPTHCATVEPQPEERAVRVRGPHEYSRMIAVIPEHYGLVRAGLPVGSKSRKSYPVWFYEVYLHNGYYRWSMGALWDATTGEVQRNFFIREYANLGDPTEQLPKPPYFPEHIGIPEGANTLKEGELQELQQARKGRLLQLRVSDAGLHVDIDLPDADCPLLADEPDHKLLLYEDRMFAHVPNTVPLAGSTAGGKVVMTWGGALSAEYRGKFGGQFEFQQMQITWDLVTGLLSTISSFTY